MTDLEALVPGSDEYRMALATRLVDFLAVITSDHNIGWNAAYAIADEVIDEIIPAVEARTRESCARAVDGLRGKSTGSWNRCCIHAANAIRALPSSPTLQADTAHHVADRNLVGDGTGVGMESLPPVGPRAAQGDENGQS